ncbi:hypothetical protein PYCC9005_001166 [Savitreella phatthalungensis]
MTTREASTLTSTSGSSSLRLDGNLLSKFRPAQAFNKGTPGTYVTSLDFDDTGEWLISCSTDDTLQVYDCRDGKHSKTCFSKKYGAHLARFAHRHTNVVYASTKENDTLRYLSLHDNSYVRYFRGHTGRVTGLEISPLDDTLLSTGGDDTVRLWDLKSPNAQGLLHIPSASLVAWDPTGLCFCVASQPSGHLSLYDVRSFDRKPFSTFHLTDDVFLSRYSYPPRMPDWSKLDISNDGKLILVATAHEPHYVLDAFTGDLVARLIDGRAVGRQLPGAGPGGSTPSSKLGAGVHGSGEAAFTPDGRFVVAGTGGDAGGIAIWDVGGAVSNTSGVPLLNRDKSLQPIRTIRPPAGAGAIPRPPPSSTSAFGGGSTTTNQPQQQGMDPCAVLAFNPRYAMLATADQNVYMWLPGQV